MMSRLTRVSIAALAIFVVGVVTFAQTSSNLAVTARATDTGSAIVLLELTTGLETVVVEDSFVNTMPVLSPNGNFIAFVSDRDGGGDLDLYLYDRQMQQIRQLTNHDGYEFDLDWSNDGSKLVYVARVEAGRQIRIVDVDDLTGSVIVEAEDNLLYPVWSPDDSRIAYVWRSGDVMILNIFRFADMNSIQVVTLPVVRPRWSPNGSMLAFRGPNANVFVLDTVSGQMQQVTDEFEATNYLWVNNSQLFYAVPFVGTHVINVDGTGKTTVVLPFAADEIAFELPKGATVPVMTLTPTPTATPTPAPTQTGGGGQIAYDGACTRPDGTGFLRAICGLNISAATRSS